jgi:toxin ParE1/3/4
MHYRLTRAAVADYRELYLYGIDNFGEQQADRYCAGLDGLLDELTRHPKRGAPVDHIRRGYRRAVYQSHSVYYRLDDEGILIVRILGQQDTGAQLPD